jgi:2'-5' RNA ligase
MATASGEARAAGWRGGLIVPVPEAEAAVGTWLDTYLPIWHLGVPAHVTLLFPFLTLDQLDPAGLDFLQARFAGQPAFEASLTAVGQFPEVVYLAPEPCAWFKQQTEALSAQFGMLPYGGIHDEVIPHLTVASHPDPAVRAEIAAALERLLPISTLVREVWLMEEARDGHWHLATRFPLGA